MLEGCLQGAFCTFGYSAIVTMFPGAMLHPFKAEFDFTQICLWVFINKQRTNLAALALNLRSL